MVRRGGRSRLTAGGGRRGGLGIGGQGSAAQAAEGRLGGTLVVVFAAVTIGLSFVLARLVYDSGANPLTLIVLRYTAFVAMVGSFCWLTRRRLVLPRRLLWASYGNGVFYLVGTGSYLASILWLPVSLAALLFYAYPLMTLIFTAALERRRPRPREMLGVLGALLGLTLALQVSFEVLAPLGVALALLGALGVSLSFVVGAHWLAGVDPLVNTLHMSVSGLVLVFAVTLGAGAFAWPAGNLGWALTLVTVLAFAAAFIAMFTSVRRIGAVRTALIMNLEPVATILFALLILGERLSATQFLGAALVIAAVVLAQGGPARAPGSGSGPGR